ncbi:MAG: 1-acyl-sn-glycerol-3-phosphate acyltransferase [Planctomycetia bacterium]|nr:1-acyl-sn-glycerol-3-phosphate acyltransferase [Planctomycetia bacterium]
MSVTPNFVGRLWYNTAYLTAYSFFTFGFSFRYSGRKNIPREGPVLLVSNHESMFDPCLVGVASGRYLSYLARSNLFTQPVLGWVIRNLHAIPIDRGMGKDGINAVLEALGKGWAVVMFPEGERTHTGEVEPLKPGVSLLIKRVKCPIVPVGIAGSFAAWSRFMKWPKLSPIVLPPRPSTLALSVGKPIDATRYQTMSREGMLDDLRQALVAQRAEAEKLRRK